jgi:hypothetical protein
MNYNLMGIMTKAVKKSGHPGEDKTKNNSEASPFFSGASIFFFKIRAKKTMN